MEKIKETNPNSQCYLFSLGKDYLQRFNDFLSYYENVLPSQIQQGNLVLWHKENKSVTHSAIVEKTAPTIKEITVRSTFYGINGLYEYKIKENPFGNLKVSFWRKKND